MQHSLKFGTSGLRGLAHELNGLPAYAHVRAFVEMLLQRGAIARNSQVFVGRDLRASSPAIAGLCLAAIADSGLIAVDCGEISTPALSLHAMQQDAPSIMVTGSHIPEDRNGLKFFRPDGEIDKADEAEISKRYAEMPGDTILPAVTAGATELTASEAYRSRYVEFFGGDALKGLRVGVYQHSSVSRDIIVDILRDLGATVTPLGRAERFLAVDTEALSEDTIALLKTWSADGYDAIVSTDGDADRPLLADEAGQFVRGDLVGAITADWLGTGTIVVPVTANSALELGGRFSHVTRTRVGSPFVIAGMDEAKRAGEPRVVGFEANGGVLLGTPHDRNGRTLAALPTRDAMLPILACLSAVAERGLPLSIVAAEHDFRSARSDRLAEVPQTVSASFLNRLAIVGGERGLLGSIGRIADADSIDGVRLYLDSGDVIHYRASGNAPELRCYVEARTDDAAAELLAAGLGFALQETRGLRQT